MVADLKRSIGRVLVMAHPFEIAVQEGLIVEMAGGNGSYELREPTAAYEAVF